MFEGRYNPADSGIIISRNCQQDLVAQGVMFDRATCDPAQDAVLEIGIDLKELGGGSDVEMFEILPRD